MPQLFRPYANTLARASLAGAGIVAVGASWAGYTVVQSPSMTRVGVPLQQPVPFSHQHHVAGLGIDCRYCHAGVETSAFAGMPSTHTCMTCHSQLWTQADVLAPVRASLVTGDPIRWQRVNDLPDYVYFDHHAHVRSGVSCTTCHGAVDTMPLTWKAHSMRMQWCLECHGDPLAHGAAPRLGGERYDKARMTSCTTCHR